ncbi:MAG: nucleotidyltransferase domain-containing protein [Actinomycetota bacterium]|nr:nucleotidyltransferase domain-containing protein [Actinomycetota bacterium]
MYGARYGGLVLYGSYARGEAREGSDVDLLVLLEGERGEEDRVERTKEVLRMEPVVWPLVLDSGYVLSVLPVGVRDFRSAEEPFLWNAREEGVARG